MKKVKIIDNSHYMKCWSCEQDKKKQKNCKSCEGTGIWQEGSFFHIVETPNGEKIAFQSDFMGK